DVRPRTPPSTSPWSLTSTASGLRSVTPVASSLNAFKPPAIAACASASAASVTISSGSDMLRVLGACRLEGGGGADVGAGGGGAGGAGGAPPGAPAGVPAGAVRARGGGQAPPLHQIERYYDVPLTRRGRMRRAARPGWASASSRRPPCSAATACTRLRPS